MPYQFFDCKVVDIVNETDSVKRFLIKTPGEMNFTFTAGQFVRLDLPIDGYDINRSYSIASPPSQDSVFELLIVLKPTGLGTNYLFHNVEKGSTIKVSKALGKLRLPETIDLDICFVCTGTGIAPLRSMLLDIFNKNTPHKNLYLVFGNRFEKDILYRKELEELERNHPEFKFIPVLSREAGWNGHKGYVHAVYEKLFAHHPGMYFYICGWHDMLREARQRIEAMGYDKKHIMFEVYD